MAEKRGSWLEGPGSARPLEPDFYKGKRLGLPESGSGALAGTGLRIGAYLIDSVIASSIARIFNGAREISSDQFVLVGGLIAFAVMTSVLLAVGGQTIGMRLLKIRVVPVGHLRFPWPLAVTIRTLLLTAFIPAVIFDRDSRGLHEKASSTAVVRV